MGITLNSSKKHPTWMPEEINNRSWMVFPSYFFGTLRIQAKVNQVLNHPEDSSFISSRPAHPGIITFFRRGAIQKRF
jgi:hypothetical protein